MKVMKILGGLFVCVLIGIVALVIYANEVVAPRQAREQAAAQAGADARYETLTAPLKNEANFLNAHKYEFNVSGATVKSAHVETSSSALGLTDAWIDLDYQADSMGWPPLSMMQAWLAQMLCSTSPDGKLTGLKVKYRLFAAGDDEFHPFVYPPIDIDSGDCR